MLQKMILSNKSIRVGIELEEEDRLGKREGKLLKK